MLAKVFCRFPPHCHGHFPLYNRVAYPLLHETKLLRHPGWRGEHTFRSVEVRSLVRSVRLLCAFPLCSYYLSSQCNFVPSSARLELRYWRLGPTDSSPGSRYLILCSKISDEGTIWKLTGIYIISVVQIEVVRTYSAMPRPGRVLTRYTLPRDRIKPS